MAFSTLNKYKIFNTTDYDVEKQLKTVKIFLKKTLRMEKVKNAVFNVILVDNKKIKQLNKTYRNIDKETDVISFALEDEENEKFNTKKRVLGDIYISVEKAKEQALEYGHSFERELSFLSVHGLLHLLGYDHMNEKDEKEMFKKQELILGERK